ncbi:hypothetical protein CEXT_265411 [Caerostris extrusa]|uniref:Uncharacterized protein n=1 Tax=Caerostris extrusa TaxID=172846 RepID=A0AAV4WF07_CAEEX|nr:hypothetical protein CEXT_265411 [Caerostris extrusa]
MVRSIGQRHKASGTLTQILEGHSPFICLRDKGGAGWVWCDNSIPQKSSPLRNPMKKVTGGRIGTRNKDNGKRNLDLAVGTSISI